MSRDRQLQKIRGLITEIEEAERVVWRLVSIATSNIVTKPEQGERHFSMEACRSSLATARMALDEAKSWIKDCEEWA